MTGDTKANSFGAALSPDGRTIVSNLGGVNNGGTALLIGASSGTVMHKIDFGTEPRVPSTNLSVQFAWSADGKVLAAGSDGDAVAILDPANGKVLTRFVARVQPSPESHGPQSVALSPDAKHVAVAGLNGRQTALWDAATGKLIAELPHEFQVDSAAFTPDGKAVITFGSTGLGYRWEIERLAEKKK